MEDKLKERKEKLIMFFERYKNIIIYFMLAVIVWLGAFIRTRVLDNLQGKFPISIDDPFIFMRYSEYIAEHGKLMAVDMLRNFPLGYGTSNESTLVAYVIAYFYKVINFFAAGFTIKEAAIWYPVVFFSLTLIFFFLFVRRLFNYKVALLSTAFLAVLPSFLFRTIAGFVDKEPLAIFFMFVTFYFYIVGWQSKSYRYNLLFGALAGIFTGLMGLTWGGVGFILLTIPVVALIQLVLDRFTKNDLLVYGSWLIVYLIMLTQFTFKYGAFEAILESFNFNLSIVVFLFAVVDFYMKRKGLYGKIESKVKIKIPSSIFGFVISAFVLLLFILVSFGPRFLMNQIPQITKKFFNVGHTRWALTVAENQQPYTTNWIGNFGWIYFLLMIIGSIVLFYEVLSKIEDKRYRYGLTLFYAAFIFSFVFSKYSSSSVLNGSTGLSNFMYAGSMIIFVLGFLIVYLYAYRSRRDIFEGFANLNKEYTFVFVFLVLNIIAARTAIRLLFTLTPITTIFVAYMIYKIYIYASDLSSRKKIYYYAGLVLVVYLVFATFFVYAQSSYNSANGIGSGYTTQWQAAMSFTRDMTPESSVFASWWDYGYIIQAEGRRATVTDPGNFIIYWNHLLGRHFLLGESSKEALEFLRIHDVDYVIIVSEDIGKYPAYATIGADENYDRYSYVSTFALDMQNTRETREDTLYMYKGSMIIEDNLNINGEVLPAGNSGIGAIVLPAKLISQDEQGVNIDFKQPVAIGVYNNKQYNLPLSCVFYNGREYKFDNYALDGCLRIIPSIQADGKTNVLGGAFYLSPRSKKTLFGQMYMMDKEWEGFSLAYSDSTPLALYQGRLIGPIKIWKVSYPPDIGLKEEYLETKYPNKALELAQ